MRARGFFVAALVIAVAVFFACGDDGGSSAGGTPSDAGSDVVTGMGGGGGGVIVDAGADAPNDASGSYNDVGDASAWTTFDLANVDPSFGEGADFFGGAFDGRYVYLAPYDRGFLSDAGPKGIDAIVVRYDTTMPFGAAGSWAKIDLTTFDGNSGGFASSVFDGRYVTLFPGPATSQVARYDTKAAFDSPDAWTFHQLDTTGYYGAAFDGRYLYAPPSYGPGKAQRYDTQTPFDAGASWTTFDPATLDAGAKMLENALFDGRYVYMAPGNFVAPDGISLRYDTTKPFGDVASWTPFDLRTRDPHAYLYAGATFDGRYVYYAPYYYYGMGQTAPIPAARYDTTASFTDAVAWTTFDTTTVAMSATGFLGAAFDGRYVWYVPWAGSTLARYDTLAAFDVKTSWTTYDLSKLDAKATRFHGAVFDGEYMYFVPSELGVIVRFDARSPPALPSSYHGSFY